MYIESKQKLVAHVQKKVEKFFDEYPVTAHGLDHVMRVAGHIKNIAVAEKARSVFLCELAALLHDIGRVPEHYEKKGTRHHELSYELLRGWYKEDAAFDILNHDEKIELLYAVRYHWNDVADLYDTAWFLRDADKLDSFGDVGLQRMREWYVGEQALGNGLRLSFQMLYDIRTSTAKKMIENEKLFDPIVSFKNSLLQKGIEPIEL